MARLAFKPDSSFFRKIAIGTVGTRAVAADLERFGHRIAELERGSTDTKLWKEVKRKRVRIPDLVCLNCGVRIESRAKTQADLSMSHSLADDTRAWDFGMINDDWIAFPVCETTEEQYWSAGRLSGVASYWHERNWVQWRTAGHINYFSVRAFRGTPPVRRSTKGVTEGSETTVAWDATFSTRSGTVEAVVGRRVTVRRTSDGHRYTWNVPSRQTVHVASGDVVTENQVLASPIPPLSSGTLTCSRSLGPERLGRLLNSRERTQRFTGTKLARLLRRAELQRAIRRLTDDPEEDVYIRLEGAAYLASVCEESIEELFAPYYGSNDEQTQLEAVIAIAEASTPGAVSLLSGFLDATDKPYFFRSAAAWALGRIGTREALSRLTRAFADVDHSIREEALEGIVTLGGPTIPSLLAGLRDTNDDVAAGCAESLRQQRQIPNEVVTSLLEELRSTNPSLWTVWLVAHLPREQVAGGIASLQKSAPHLHYALTLLWSFAQSWIARRWELNPHHDGAT